MSAREAELFKNFVTQSKCYFEFGLGGSTLFAAGVVDGPLVAIDSDVAWIEKISQQIAPSGHERRLIHVDIGPTGNWGVPISSDHRPQYPKYHETILNASGDFDLCLVDGRFRVACFLQALRRLDRNAIIGVHDYRSRSYYHAIEEFARPIAEAEDLTFFVSKTGAKSWAIESALEAYRYDQR
ncbi:MULTISPECIES: hypothetical protein [unclassified Methylobacterium]|uniref:hypothetical protein n=1 Tax=unclassified Methylobacterium TaxID=2615210 RepID=UPI0012E32F37|nr:MULTISPECIES: hypothetical protein [unclassified Methylobacterium]